MKQIPDFNIELAQSVDFILGSSLARKAMENPPYHNFTNILVDIIENIDRLADNCHMPEFTNHAMPHICSIVKRASEWGETDGWLDKLEPKEAAYLLMALLLHDIGMLSQDVQDLPEEEQAKFMKGCSDIPNWVRRTHVLRINKLTKRLLQEYRNKDMELDRHLDVIIGMAASHAKWPWNHGFHLDEDICTGVGVKAEHVWAMSAVIAVCDLLDEDSNRCDTVTLIRHRHGSMENMAHWIRHAITESVVGVKNKTVVVKFRKLLPSSKEHETVYRALRNHYRLIKLYNNVLKELDAEILHIDFIPNDGIPEFEDEVSENLRIWQKIQSLRTASLRS